MRQVVAIAVGGAFGLGLMALLNFLLEVLQLSIGDYTYLVVGLVAGLFIGFAIGLFSRPLGTVVGLISIILLGVAGSMVGPSLAEILIEALSYFLAGLVAGAFSGVRFDQGYGLGRGAVLPGLLASILLLGLYIAYDFGRTGEIIEAYAIALPVVFAVILGTLGGAIGGQIGGVRV